MKLKAAVLIGSMMLAGSALAAVNVSAPWVRSTVPGQKVTGAFMQLTADTDSQLTAVSSPVAGHTEIHEMKREGDVMQMRAVPDVALPKGKAVALEPGTYHIMLFELKHPLKSGEKVPLTLTVQTKGKPAETVKVEAIVKDGFK